VTAVQLALCEPTWNDPEPDDDEDNGPWCYRPPLRNDLWGQGLYNRPTRRITNVPLTGAYL
jgi:hypothetical protein